MRTLIMGLGNPILGDDGAGWRAAQALEARLAPDGDARVECASLGGLSLMERLAGWPRVILIDAIRSRAGEAGAVRVLPLQALPDPMQGHSASAHDTSLLTALETGRRMGMELPGTIMVVAIEAGGAFEFSEELSPEVEAALPVVVQAVLDLL